MQKNKKTAFLLWGVAFVWFTTHFGGGFASGAQIYSYYVRFGHWCLFMPVIAMLYNALFFAYSLRFAKKHEVYDYRSYNNAFYGKFAPIFSNLFEVLYDLQYIQEFQTWVAHYNTPYPTYPYTYQIWQYSDAGEVDGINVPVDLDLMFVPKQ